MGEHDDNTLANIEHGLVVVQPLDDRQQWEKYLAEHHAHTFLHSWAWGEFNRRQGHQIFRLGFFNTVGERELRAVALVVHVTARRGSFLLCPHGPVVTPEDAGPVIRALTAYLRSLGTQLHARFIRLCTQLPDQPEFQSLLRQHGYRPAPIHLHPELAWLLNLQPSEPELLAGMRKTMRNLVRRSQRAGITIRPVQSSAEFSQFLELYRQTADRHHYVAFPEAYLVDELASFGTQDALILLAEHSGTLLAGAFIVFSGRSAFYHHGASQPSSNHLPAAYLLQWEAIRSARRRGCQWYNFWGIAPRGSTRHPWAGLTQFKQGFGGFSQAYLHAQDYPLRLSYWVTYIIERARRFRRGL